VRVGVPREVRSHERRVALVPEVTAAIVAAGHEVLVESGAGHSAHHADAEYQEAGAEVVADAAAVYAGAECIAKVLAPAGMIWISWPKKSSGVPTDLNENIVRDIGLAAGLVDVKVCAVTDIWSGLKFVRRLKDRGPKEKK